jgi:hypothetical protein
VPKKLAPNWRVNHRNFVRKSSKNILEPGAVVFSAGWFGQGHTVGFHLNSINECNSFDVKIDHRLFFITLLKPPTATLSGIKEMAQTFERYRNVLKFDFISNSSRSF